MINIDIYLKLFYPSKSQKSTPHRLQNATFFLTFCFYVISDVIYHLYRRIVTKTLHLQKKKRQSYIILIDICTIFRVFLLFSKHKKNPTIRRILFPYKMFFFEG